MPAVAEDANAEMTVDDARQKREIGVLATGLVNLCERDLDRVHNCLKEVLWVHWWLRSEAPMRVDWKFITFFSLLIEQYKINWAPIYSTSTKNILQKAVWIVNKW